VMQRRVRAGRAAHVLHVLVVYFGNGHVGSHHCIQITTAREIMGGY
jgi:hypothetical protein